MAQNQAKFLQGSLLRHITVMSSAASLGLMAIFLVDLVDMLFISMLGNEALAAAVGYAGAILFFTTSLSIGLAITAGALAARALGQGDEARAREVLTHVLIVGVIFALVVVALVWFSLPFLTGLVGATGETQRLAVRYLSIIVPGMPLMMIAMVCSAVLRGHGDAKMSTWVTLSGGLVNAVLDPILIFGLDMGLDGAAWATLVARFTMFAVALWPILRTYGGFVAVNAKAIIADLSPILAIAVPSILANIATPIGAAYVTRTAAQFGEEAVAGMAIVGRLTPVAFGMIFALSGAIGPIIGQNFGARNFDRVRRAFIESLWFTAAYVVCAVLILVLLRNSIVEVFSATGVARNLIFLFCGPLSLAWIFNGVIFVGNAAYNNLGYPYYSTSINWLRNTLGIVPFVWLGARFWGAEGVLIGQMAGGVFVALLSYVLTTRVIARVSVADVPDLTRPVFSAHNRTFRLFNHRR